MPWKEQLVIPIGDIQAQPNHDMVDWKRLKRTIDFGVAHDALFIGMGDYADLESPSNRAMLDSTGFYDSVVDALDLKAEEIEAEVQELFAPTRGRWLGVLEGHHYHRYQDGTTTDTRMAQFLGCHFLGTSAYVNLAFQSPAKHGIVPINIWAHHGRAGGKLLSTPINQLEHVIKGFDADIYLLGHHHKSAVARHSRIYPVFGPKVGTLDHRDSYLVACGAFLKGYLEGHKKNGRASGAYAEAGMMNPLSLGGVKIWLRPHYENVRGSGAPRVDISVEV